MKTLEELFHDKGVLETQFQAADSALFTANLKDPFNYALIDDLAMARRKLFNQIQAVDSEIAKEIAKQYHGKKTD